MNSDLSDIATGLSTAVTKDGQTTITNPIRFANGAVGLPAITFASDTDTGIYRIGTNELGITVGGTLIIDVTATGIAITGTFTPSGQILGPADTVALPNYTWASDPDSGMYRIGANNVGISVNATKILDISTAGLNVIGTVSSNGAVLAPIAAGVTIQNGTIVESHAGNAVTFALKTLSGADPSSGNPVFMIFRDVTAATGDYVVRTITAALSVTVSSGSTLGTSNGVACRIWIGALDNAGTPELFVINCVSGTGIYPLGQFPLITTTAEGGAGGADSAQVPYSTTARTAKPYIILAYASYESGLATAGNWAVSPTRLQLFGPGVPLPTQPLQRVASRTGAVSTTANQYTISDTLPTTSNGGTPVNVVITPTSAANIIRVDSRLIISSDNSAAFLTAYIVATGSSNAVSVSQEDTSGATHMVTMTNGYEVIAGVTTAITYSLYGSGSAGTMTFNGQSGARKLGGAANTEIIAVEYMT